jgi:hypothetical protein
MSLRLMLRRGLDREPMVVVGAGFAAIGLTAVMFGVPIRRGLGLNTDNWDNGEAPTAIKSNIELKTWIKGDSPGSAPKVQ